MLLSSPSTQKSISEGLGTFSRSHESDMEYGNIRLETPASSGRGEHSVRTMKEMVQRHKDSVFSLGIHFSIKHPLLALLEWILNQLASNDFLVELDNRVIKTSPCESHTGNPAPIVSRSVDVMMTTNNRSFSKLGFSV